MPACKPAERLAGASDWPCSASGAEVAFHVLMQLLVVLNRPHSLLSSQTAQRYCENLTGRLNVDKGLGWLPATATKRRFVPRCRFLDSEGAAAWPSGAPGTCGAPSSVLGPWDRCYACWRLMSAAQPGSGLGEVDKPSGISDVLARMFATAPVPQVPKQLVSECNLGASQSMHSPDSLLMPPKAEQH